MGEGREGRSAGPSEVDDDPLEVDLLSGRPPALALWPAGRLKRSRQSLDGSVSGRPGTHNERKRGSGGQYIYAFGISFILLHLPLASAMWRFCPLHSSPSAWRSPKPARVRRKEASPLVDDVVLRHLDRERPGLPVEVAHEGHHVPLNGEVHLPAPEVLPLVHEGVVHPVAEQGDGGGECH